MRSKRWRTAVLAACVLVLGAAVVTDAGEQGTARQVETNARRVALFKNGLAYFTVEGKLPEEADGTLRFGPFLAPAHGTFWVNYPQDVPLKGLVAREVDLTKEKRAATVRELLKGNLGRQVSLYFDPDGEPTVEGKLTSVPRGRPEPGPRRYMAGGDADEESRGYRRWEDGQLVLVRTSAGTVAVNPRRIERVDFPGAEPSPTFGQHRKGAELLARLREPAPDKSVTINYLAKGLTWAPSYRVDLTGDETARLSAKAVIVNDAVDMEGVEVELVTGFPHLRYSDVLSPLGMKQNLSQFLQSLGEGESEDRRREAAMMQQAVARGYGGGPGAPAMPDYGAAAEGRMTEDLFLYPVGKVTLSEGERGYYPLFTASVPCEHIYRWHIPDNRGSRGRRSQEEGHEPKVWHSLRLENTGNVPWTTAPAETVRDGQILGQDVLKYTPTGGEQTLRITRAADVKADAAEFEVGLERDVEQYHGRSYDRVTVEGRLKVTNYKEKTITMEVTKTVSGEVDSSDPSAEVQTIARGVEEVNPVNELTWEFELQPGASKELTYTCDVLVRM